jgi:hypothetical protein
LRAYVPFLESTGKDFDLPDIDDAFDDAVSPHEEEAKAYRKSFLESLTKLGEHAKELQKLEMDQMSLEDLKEQKSLLSEQLREVTQKDLPDLDEIASLQEELDGILAEVERRGRSSRNDSKHG